MKSKKNNLFSNLSRFIVAMAIPAILILNPLQVRAFDIVEPDDGSISDPGNDTPNPDPVPTTAPPVINPVDPGSNNNTAVDSPNKANPGTSDMNSIIIVATLTVGGTIVLASKKLKEKTNN